MTPSKQQGIIQLALPKGRMHAEVVQLLADAGIRVSASARDYRPSVSLDGFEVKVLKPRAIVEMLGVGARDLGFAGADWVAEHNAQLVEILDTGLNPVRLVAAAPNQMLEGNRLPNRTLIVASEYVSITKRWIIERGLDAKLLRSYGATEVLPPEDADFVIDNTATGSTLAANNLRIFDELMTSSTRLYASKYALKDPQKKESIGRFALLIGAVLEARQRVMIEVNVSAESLDALVSAMPCMREPTVSPLRSEGGYAIKAAVPRRELARVIPELKRAGGTDLIVSEPELIIP